VQVFNYGSIPLGAVAGGALASHLGVRAALWIMLSGLALSALILLTGPRRRAGRWMVSSARGCIAVVGTLGAIGSVISAVVALMALK
jgi:hypothetical protein